MSPRSAHPITEPEVPCVPRGPTWTDALPDRDSPIVLDAAAGDPDALTDLLDCARPIIYRWAAWRIEDLDDAEDVTQAVLLRLWSGLPGFRGESRLSSWLYRVTTNEALGRVRQKSKEISCFREWAREIEHGPSVPDHGSRIDHERMREFVRAAACALPPLQMAAFRLVDLDGMRPCEAAHELGRNQANIRSSLCRARRKVRELMME